ncbi:helix-turn-helix domain-containing protein [Noviherbaspirillum cavernae]|uniref:Helix-turn-helix domain-containing protein n=1 Tax=Noviherbaspirillum cavernae TaxID=2320862 RepID=A0A418X4T2_9BURK|nr:helix-turn-helix domain-containing protein [Noviherbaspirillum cavernae]RJG07497.1 helix-turn-helix domain-containing protein [Noviherbaspirillum cavernae]
MEQLTTHNQPALAQALPVYFLLRKGIVALDLIGPAEVLRYANRAAEKEGRPALFSLHYISAEPSLEMSIGLGLTGFGGLPDSLPANAMLMLIGCAGSDDDFSSETAQAAVAWLHRHVTREHRLLGICTGALLAGHAGLLDGRQCTTHHSHCDSLRMIAPRAHVQENRIFVEDGPAFTSAGVTAGIDLALHIVAQVAGHRVAAIVARSMVIYMRRAGTDPQFSPWLAFRNHLHPAVHRVQDAIVGNPAHDWNVPQLAQIACTSERHLTRLFREHAGASLVDYLQCIRIALARDLLTQSQLDIERVAERAGFHSSRQLRRVWKKFEGASPSRLRATEKAVELVN